MPANVTGALPAQAATVDLVRHVCAPDDVPFETTADVPADAGAFGQARALEALDLATAIPSDGYNVYATGVPGTGRRTMLGDWLRERAAARPAPPDIVQLCNFADPLRPHAVSLPAGSARALADDVSTLVDAVRRGLRKAFESDNYRAQHRK